MDYFNSFITDYLPKFNKSKDNKDKEKHFMEELEKVLNELPRENKNNHIKELIKNPTFINKFIQNLNQNLSQLSNENIHSIFENITIDNLFEYIKTFDYNQDLQLFLNVSCYLY
jgi:aspartokinase